MEDAGCANDILIHWVFRKGVDGWSVIDLKISCDGIPFVQALQPR